jgi:release factor glutamine methyltransferase
MLAKRLCRIPIAYIIGFKEFYGRQFITTPAALIPRPESETIIDLLKSIPISHFPTPNPKIVDVGTGSGCLGITAKLEIPQLSVTLTDISSDALNVARQNAEKLSAKVDFGQYDLLNDYHGNTDIIIANLPYVDRVWERSAETNYEPDLALFADNNGKSLIELLIKQATNVLNPLGYLILEADPMQHHDLTAFAKKYDFENTSQIDYALSFRYQPRKAR